MPHWGKVVRRATGWAVFVAVFVAIVLVARAFYMSHRTIFDLLKESQRLRAAISNLTAERTIAYAKVTAQRVENGRTITEVRFVLPALDDPARPVLEKRVALQGDVIHFDALIVKFDEQWVQDGKARALYLWRRIYDEFTPPERGIPIETEGVEPERYREVFALVPARLRHAFWSEIWNLANDPQRLKKLGITAVYGNDLYQQLRPGRTYRFQLGNNGEFYVETMPEI